MTDLEHDPENVAHRLDNRGVAFDAVGCSCGWSAKSTMSDAKREALSVHQMTSAQESAKGDDL